MTRPNRSHGGASRALSLSATPASVARVAVDGCRPVGRRFSRAGVARRVGSAAGSRGGAAPIGGRGCT
eukprot:11173778-Lingulodinium_polyedra.AAC.1